MSDEIQRSLGRIEGLLEGINERLIEHFNDDKIAFGKVGVQYAEMRKEVDGLQRTRAWASGWGAAAGSGISLIAAFIFATFRGH